MSHVVLLGSDNTLAQRVQSIPGHQASAFSRTRMDELAHVDGFDSLLAVPGGLADVVIFGQDLPVAESLSMAESIAVRYPWIQLVLVAEPDTDLVLRAMRSGVRDIVSTSIGEDDLKVLLHRFTESARVKTDTREPAVEEPSDPHRVIVVAGPKGGVGRSTVATNVAVGLSRNAPMDTVLVDLDLGFGDAGGLLNLNPVHTIADAFGSSASLDPLILKTILTVHPAGFYVLCCADSPAMADEVSAAQTGALVRQLSSQFRYVVVDTSSGMDAHTLGAIEEASDLILVSSMDVSSAHALRKEIKLLTELDIVPSSRHVVMNFADRRSGIGIREVEAVIGLPVQVVVPRSLKVQMSNDLGEAVMEKRRRGSVVKAFDRLVELIHADELTATGSKHRGVFVH
jgi:pilus assembly protein CpaE